MQDMMWWSGKGYNMTNTVLWSKEEFNPIFEVDSYLSLANSDTIKGEYHEYWIST